MDIEIEVYLAEPRRFFGKIDFGEMLRAAALRHFGEEARKGQIEMQIEGPPDHRPWTGPPRVTNTSKRFGHCNLRLLRDDAVVREDHLPIAQVLGPVLAERFREMAPREEDWEFELRLRHSRAIVLVVTERLDRRTGEVRPAPETEGSVEVDPGERRHRPFTLTPIAAAEAEQVEPGEQGLDPDKLGRINILMPAHIHDQLVRDMPMSDRMEEGGFLLGKVRKAGEDAHLVEITHVTPAHQSGAGLAHFTFTGDSFLAAAKLIADRDQDELLVGWYHTHLFGADDKMGLSSIDVDLHRATFQRPWQVAGLLNITRKSRVLRFYGRDDGPKLREYDQWIADDSGRYRPAGRPMGGR